MNYLALLAVLVLLVLNPVSGDQQRVVPRNEYAVWDLLECARFVMGNNQNSSLMKSHKSIEQKVCLCIENMVEVMGTLAGSGFGMYPKKCGLHLVIPVPVNTEFLNRTALSISLQLTHSF